MNIEDIRNHYKEKKAIIEDRLKEFDNLKSVNDYRLFLELVFVILSSQTDAEDAWKAAEELDEKNLLIEGNDKQISKVLARNEVAFEEKKADYIIENRKMLSQPTLSNPTNELKIREKLDEENILKTRKWLVDNISGIGWKGASHFLRNIGYGDNLAIISRHTLSQLNEVFEENIELPESEEEYLNLEKKMRKLSEKTKIDVKALDLVLWSMKTGKVFK